MTQEDAQRETEKNTLKRLLLIESVTLPVTRKQSHGVWLGPQDLVLRKILVLMVPMWLSRMLHQQAGSGSLLSVKSFHLH